MNDFKRGGFGGKKDFGRSPRPAFGSKPSFGAKPAYQRGGFGRPQSEMHSAVCANCGKDTQVPFRPDGTRPIYCRDCFGNGNDSRPQRDQQRPERPAFQRSVPMQHSAPAQYAAPAQPARQVPDARIDDIQKQLAKVQVKLDQVLLALAVAKAQPTFSPEPVAAKKKKAAPKKK